MCNPLIRNPLIRNPANHSRSACIRPVGPECTSGEGANSATSTRRCPLGPRKEGSAQPLRCTARRAGCLLYTSPSPRD
eukprot:2585178-Alexandrium_andersonii.AAC.1